MIRPPASSQGDVIVFELLRTPAGATRPEVVGTATFVGGAARIEAPESVRVPIEEQLERGFVDRVQADERPPGYRRSGRAAVDLLVPGMPEHFLARMRGLWLSYPDGTVVTARPGEYRPPPRRPPGAVAAPLPKDPAARQAALADTEQAIARFAHPNPPESGLRPPEVVPVGRTDCGWLR
jgi:hypothetical protein